jgi:hypothetical protein
MTTFAASINPRGIAVIRLMGLNMGCSTNSKVFGSIIVLPWGPGTREYVPEGIRKDPRAAIIKITVKIKYGCGDAFVSLII